jgi:hypothetical protein
MRSAVSRLPESPHRDFHLIPLYSIQLKGTAMNRVRGVVMLIAGCFALYEAWRVHNGQRAGLALALGLLAIALGMWHLTRKDPKRP